MKVHFTVTFLFFFSSLFSQVADTVFNQKDSRGLKQGVWKNTWIETGHLASIETYKDDVRNGFCKYYYENGVLQSTGYFRGNSVDGEFRSYYKSGILYEIKNYEDNVRNGWTIYYDTLGRFASEALWKNGRAFGLFKEYEAGKLIDSAFAFESYNTEMDFLIRQEYNDSKMKNLRTEYFYSDEKHGGERPFMIRHYLKASW